MVKTISILIFLFLVTKAGAQFSTKVEYEYLKLLNNGSPKSLHEDNFRNAELVFDSLILKPNDRFGAKFLKELAASYSFCEEEELAIYTAIRQLSLFSNDSINYESQKILNLNMLKEGFSILQIQNLLKEINNETPMSGYDKVVVLTFKLGFDDLNRNLEKLISQVNTHKLSPSSNLISQVEYLLDIKLKPNLRNQFVYQIDSDLNAWKSKLEPKLSKLIIKADIRYFRKLNNRTEFRNSIKKLKLSGYGFQDKFLVFTNRVAFLF